RLACGAAIPSEIAMEQHMACGFGDCHGCVIQVNADPDGTEKAWREDFHHRPGFKTWEVVDAVALSHGPDLGNLDEEPPYPPVRHLRSSRELQPVLPGRDHGRAGA